MKYSDNYSKEMLERLIKVLKKDGQTLEYFNHCAKRMGRMQKKYTQIKKWPGHIKNKYYYVTEIQKRAEHGLVFTA